MVSTTANEIDALCRHIKGDLLFELTVEWGTRIDVLLRRALAEPAPEAIIHANSVASLIMSSETACGAACRLVQALYEVKYGEQPERWLLDAASFEDSIVALVERYPCCTLVTAALSLCIETTQPPNETRLFALVRAEIVRSEGELEEISQAHDSLSELDIMLCGATEFFYCSSPEGREDAERRFHAALKLVPATSRRLLARFSTLGQSPSAEVCVDLLTKVMGATPATRAAACSIACARDVLAALKTVPLAEMPRRMILGIPRLVMCCRDVALEGGLIEVVHAWWRIRCTRTDLPASHMQTEVVVLQRFVISPWFESRYDEADSDVLNMAAQGGIELALSLVADSSPPLELLPRNELNYVFNRLLRHTKIRTVYGHLFRAAAVASPRVVELWLDPTYARLIPLAATPCLPVIAFVFDDDESPSFL